MFLEENLLTRTPKEESVHLNRSGQEKETEGEKGEKKKDS